MCMSLEWEKERGGDREVERRKEIYIIYVYIHTPTLAIDGCIDSDDFIGTQACRSTGTHTEMYTYIMSCYYISICVRVRYVCMSVHSVQNAYSTSTEMDLSEWFTALQVHCQRVSPPPDAADVQVIWKKTFYRGGSQLAMFDYQWITFGVDILPYQKVSCLLLALHDLVRCVRFASPFQQVWEFWASLSLWLHNARAWAKPEHCLRCPWGESLRICSISPELEQSWEQGVSPYASLALMGAPRQYLEKHHLITSNINQRCWMK